MAKLVDNRDRKNPYSRIMSGLTPFQHKAHYKDEKDHKADKETIFRIIPEYAADGSRLPMVISGGGEDLDYSNIHEEAVTLFAGEKEMYSGWGRPSDRDITDAIDMVFPGTYIRLKGRSNKNELGDALDYKFTKLTKRVNNRQAMERPSEVRILQCIIIKANGKVLEKPATYQGLILSKMAAAALNRLLVKCHAEGRDVFSPEGGALIHLDSQIFDDEGQVREIAKHTASLGKDFPLKEEQCKKLWIPWEKVFKRDTYETQFRAAVKGFGREIVEAAFPEEYERFYGSSGGGGIIDDSGDDTPFEGPWEKQPPKEEEKPSAPAIEIDLDNKVDLEGDDEGEEESVSKGSAAPEDAPEIRRPSRDEQERAYDEVMSELDDMDI